MRENQPEVPKLGVFLGIRPETLCTPRHISFRLPYLPRRRRSGFGEAAERIRKEAKEKEEAEKALKKKKEAAKIQAQVLGTISVFVAGAVSGVCSGVGAVRFDPVSSSACNNAHVRNR